jgi:prevent-host-death family protein
MSAFAAYPETPEPNTIGLRELNQNPSRAVARVRETGIPLVITDRGTPVLRLVPEQPLAHGLLAHMAERGEALPPASRDMPDLIPELAPDVDSLADLVIADRDKDRRRGL